jgi:mRNA interferase MazF
MHSHVAADLVVVLPITSRLRRLPSRVRIAPPEGGLRMESGVIGEQVRTVSKSRLTSRLGAVSPATMRAVSDVVRLLLDL